jgi:CrcB protein
LVIAFPFATFGINIAGSLLIGLLFGLSQRGYLVMHDWLMFLTVGICGGFTTFSTFSLENLILLREGDYMNFMIYAFGSLLLGLLAVWAGYWLAK